MFGPKLESLFQYALKSFDGRCLMLVEMNAQSRINYDRKWKFERVDGLLVQGKTIVDGKRYPILHQIRTQIQDDFQHIKVQYQSTGERHLFSLKEPEDFNRWLGKILSAEVKLLENDAGFPDEPNEGATLISRETLQELCKWFPSITYDNMRARLRPNIVVSWFGKPPFWEEYLAQRRSFAIGNTTFIGTGLVERCAVPSRDPTTGEALKGFQAQFSKARKENPPFFSQRNTFEKNGYFAGIYIKRDEPIKDVCTLQAGMEVFANIPM